MKARLTALGALVVGAFTACGSTSSDSGTSRTGSDGGTGSSGADGGGGGLFGSDDGGQFGHSSGDGGSDGGCGHQILATVRDFKPFTQGGHQDFENDAYTSDTATLGLVKVDLGADQKPVYALPGSSKATTGPAQFAQWYNDVPGVNIAIPVTLQLVESPPGSGTFVYQNDAFFPIDGQGFGNGPPLKDGTNVHNFSFTTEVHLSFTYAGGEVFSFRGDDDLWVFINRHLAIDLGGLHPQLDGSANLDAMASQLGLTKGQQYAMDIFHAERHTDASHFNVTTTIGCFTPTVPK